MLDTPALLNQPMAIGDSVVAINNGRDLAVDDFLEVDRERMQIDQVISPNNYHVKTPATMAHAVNAVVCQLPNPNVTEQINSNWIDPEARGWQPIAGVWTMGRPALP